MCRWSVYVTGKLQYGMHGQQLNFYHTNSRQLKRHAVALQQNLGKLLSWSWSALENKEIRIIEDCLHSDSCNNYRRKETLLF